MEEKTTVTESISNNKECKGCIRRPYSSKVCFFDMMNCLSKCPCVNCLIKVMCKEKGSCDIRNEVINNERRLQGLQKHKS